VSPQVAALEHELVLLRSPAGEVELDELARDRREQFGLAAALRLGRRHLFA
jgi:hypothetical protein